MKWLSGSMIASIIGAFLVVRLFEYIAGGTVHGVAASTAKASLFVTTWTAITTGSGMRSFSASVRQLRKTTASLSGWLNTRR